MGSLHAHAIAADTTIPLEKQLEWHLQGNHFPPIPKSMVVPCEEAIQAFWEDDLERLISLPDGVGYKGLTVAPARAIIIEHHLDAWCVEHDEEDSDF